MKLWLAAAAGILGAVVLAFYFDAWWPAARWQVAPRDQLIDQGRQVARHFGADLTGWKTSTKSSVAKSLAHWERDHSFNASPLNLRITYTNPQDGRTAEAGFDSAGRLNYWRPPTPYRTVDPNEVFQYVAGPRAAEFREPLRTSGDEEREKIFEWRFNHAPHSEIREAIKVDMNGQSLKSVERTVSIAGTDSDSEDDYGRDYWDFLAGIFGLICIVGTIAILSIYVLWLVRRAVNHLFPGLLAAVILLLAFIKEPSVGAFFFAATALCVIAVGRGISVRTLPKWRSLEQLFHLAPLGKGTGAALFAGILVGPFLTAIPFLVAACKLFPQTFVLPNNAELIYSDWPLFHALNLPMFLYLLAFFGFAAPAIERLLRFKWLAWLALALVGTLFFSDTTRLATGPIAVPLITGALVFAASWFLWAQFDLLAVLTAHLVSAWLLTSLILKFDWFFVLAVVALAAFAVWCILRGEPVMEGDPRASVPALASFRAEREKLKAEFSVARRAQQDMLPQTPPAIPGFTIAAACTPSLEVGGDLYDFLNLADGRIAIGVADVSGKGVPAALYMTLTKGLLASITKSNSKLAEVVSEVNRHLHTVTRKRVFVTMALGFLDPAKRTLEYVRAGHNPIVWRRPNNDATTLVSPSGIGLGITAGRIFNTQLKAAELLLEAGDAVVFYSDGITEAMNSAQEQFGEQRLMDSLKRADDLDAVATRDSILREVTGFLDGVHPQDDMTLVVLRVEPQK